MFITSKSKKDVKKTKVFSIDFIGIGAERSGTTWLVENLKKHPNVCISYPKEINYFNRYSNFSDNDGKLNKNYENDIEWYKSCFLHCKESSIKGEFSTSYLYDKYAPSKIKLLFPNVKIICSLRNPLERIVSSYKWNIQYNKSESREINDALKTEPEYLGKSLYYEQLIRYYNAFPKSQIYIVYFEDIVKEPYKVIENIYKFLEIQPIKVTNKNINKVVNKNRQTRYKIINKLATSLYYTIIKLKLTFIIYLLDNYGVKSLFVELNSKESSQINTKINSETLQFLKNKINNDITKLEILLDKDLKKWYIKTNE